MDGKSDAIDGSSLALKKEQMERESPLIEERERAGEIE